MKEIVSKNRRMFCLVLSLTTQSLATTITITIYGKLLNLILDFFSSISTYHKLMFSLFLSSAHFGALGTSRPTRYIVLHDDSEFSGDDIQKTTNLLSYLFPRCTKATSIPPAVSYAHLAAKRARSYLLILDNNRGQVFGENELTPDEIKDVNKKIEVKDEMKNILYFV